MPLLLLWFLGEANACHVCVGQVTLSDLIGGGVSVLAGLGASGVLLSHSFLPIKVHTTRLGFLMWVPRI